MIDEKKLIEDCKKYLEDTYTFQTPLEYSVAMTRLLKIIKAQPTIESEQVKHGEWTYTGIEELDLIYSGYKCSQCGFILCGNQTKYCPGCGAKMAKQSPENHKKYQEEETNKKAFK